MKFAQGLGLLDAMTIGAEKPEHMDDTLRLLAKCPRRSSSEPAGASSDASSCLMPECGSPTMSPVTGFPRRRSWTSTSRSGSPRRASPS